jgi:hypothetical protein
MSQMSKIRTFNKHVQKNNRKMQTLCKISRYSNAHVLDMQIDRVMFSYIIEICKLWRSSYSKWHKMWAFSSNRNQIKKEWSIRDLMNNTNIQEIRFLQHNCAKFTNTMISCLKYDLKKKINIICMQESWIETNQIIISHSTYNRILFDQEESHKQRVIIFVFKSFKFSVTFRSNLCTNTNIQIFNISKTNIEKFIIVNVYNEKCQKSNSNEYTIERKLKTIELTKNSFVCDDFNALHQWWNSRIASSIRANALIEWLNKFNCELINISNDYTFNRENSCSVIDLTFATVDLASKITNWSINDDAKTNSNHEVIQFSINVEDFEIVNNLMTEKFNTQKANWNKFNQYFKKIIRVLKAECLDCWSILFSII